LNRIGVLGGTFDPLHLGHLRAAEVVRDALSLDRVLFVPAKNPPHKSAPRLTEAGHRLHMVERALEGEESFDVSRIEIEREGLSYTIDTLAELGARSADSRLFFVTGTDSFADIRTWRRWHELLSEHSFVVHERPGFPIDSARAVVPQDLAARVIDDSDRGFDAALPGARIFLVRRPMLDVSSTEIRTSVRAGRSIRFLVPDAVAAYIRENRLYE
jgi:nicotinate-nucleotide adenylyltransferase